MSEISEAINATEIIQNLSSATNDDDGVLNDMAKIIHFLNAKWWYDINTGVRLDRNKGELLMLIVSEIAETLEGVRKNEMDKHLPHRKAEEVELADALIRLLDYAGAHKLDLSGAVREKLIYNFSRHDHTAEGRRAVNGKKF